MSDKFYLCLTTTDSSESADKLAQTLLDEKQAGCISILPGLRSFYHWEGRVERSEEQLLLIKTTEGKLEALKARIQELHQYSVPEFIALSIDVLGSKYEKWLSSVVRC